MVTGRAYVCLCVCAGGGMDEDEITLVVVVALSACGKGVEDSRVICFCRGYFCSLLCLWVAVAASLSLLGHGRGIDGLFLSLPVQMCV
jgi:hypothetical protein